MIRRLILLAVALPAVLVAQGVRLSGVTSVQLVELRQLVKDSLDQSLVPGSGEWRVTTAGVPALCPVNGHYCVFEASGKRISAAPLLQDLTIAGWGWMEGLSFEADLRARTQLGSDHLTFPRANDHFNVLDAYAQLERTTWRGRLGRQWVNSGLGAFAFDGADGLWRHDALTLEGWSGRALVGGLNESYTSAQLAAVDNLPPQEGGYIFGARARLRPDPLTAASLTYQRVLVGDRSGLYSERAAFDASTHKFGASITGSATYDFAQADWNEGRLRVATSGTRTLGYSAELRHSRPYFELWTIWGAFAPVGFDEERATVNWNAPGSTLTLSARGAYRTYAPTNTANALVQLRTNGWRAGGDAFWHNVAGYSAYGSYDVDIGSGAASTDVRFGGKWTSSEDRSFGVDATVTQNIYEFRVGTGRIYGLGVNGATRIRPDVRVVGDIALYKHTLTNGAPGPDWTQRRASLRLEWTLGRDPGAKAP